MNLHNVSFSSQQRFSRGSLVPGLRKKPIVVSSGEKSELFVFIRASPFPCASLTLRFLCFAVSFYMRFRISIRGCVCPSVHPSIRRSHTS